MIFHPPTHQLLQVVLLDQRDHNSLVESVCLRVDGLLSKIHIDLSGVLLIVDMQQVRDFSVDPLLVFWLKLLHLFDELD